jgi:hypothetical protein
MLTTEEQLNNIQNMLRFNSQRVRCGFYKLDNQRYPVLGLSTKFRPWDLSSVTIGNLSLVRRLSSVCVYSWMLK